jgi:hypothetical protein
MTLWVSRDGQDLTIHGNTGLDVEVKASRVAGFGVTEDAVHLRHFHGELGVRLDEAEAEAAVPVEKAEV